MTSRSQFAFMASVVLVCAEPSFAQTGATKPAATVASTPALDVLGAKLGMSADEIRKAWQAAGFKLEANATNENKVELNNFPEARFLSSVGTVRQIDPTNFGREGAAAVFAGPGNPEKAYIVSRLTNYGSVPALAPTPKVVADALIAKLGPPSHDKSYSAGTRVLYWWWGPNGLRTPDDRNGTCVTTLERLRASIPEPGRSMGNPATMGNTANPNVEGAGCHKGYVAGMSINVAGLVTTLTAAASDFAGANAAQRATFALIDKLEAAQKAGQLNQAQQNKPRL